MKCCVQMSLTFAGAVASRAALSRLPPQLLPRAAPLSLAAPAPCAVAQRSLQRTPVALATAVAASCTAGRSPVVSVSVQGSVGSVLQANCQGEQEQGGSLI